MTVNACPTCGHSSAG
uniref:Uncharacterized protein n=1 Tax=Rhizophora mucronata TaxID=61149 RepID=A0A2P2QFR1_RHIMU